MGSPMERNYLPGAGKRSEPDGDASTDFHEIEVLSAAEIAAPIWIAPPAGRRRRDERRRPSRVGLCGHSRRQREVQSAAKRTRELRRSGNCRGLAGDLDEVDAAEARHPESEERKRPKPQ